MPGQKTANKANNSCLHQILWSLNIPQENFYVLHSVSVFLIGDGYQLSSSARAALKFEVKVSAS